MSAVKPVVSEAALLDLLAGAVGGSVSQVRELEGGLIARTFAFAAGGREYVVRFMSSAMDTSFDKEAFIARNLSSARVPIPAIVRTGRAGDFRYCISERIAGEPFKSLRADAARRALPSLLDTLDAIHAVDVAGYAGHGLFDDAGRGYFPSWGAELKSVRDEERPDGFYGKWHPLFETTFLERDLFDRVFARMEELLPYCAPERYLVHGGYGGGNVLVAGGRIVAVLDWADARYGDFLYDVGWLDFWDDAHGFADLCRSRYGGQGRPVPYYRQRVLCYECRIALDAMRFFAKTGDEKAYAWVRERIVRRMEA